MINPFLTNNQWAMHEPRLQSIADKVRSGNISAGPAIEDASGGYPTQSYQLVSGVAVMSLTGPMMKYADFWCWYFGGTSTLALKQNLQAALDDPSVQATLIIVDSPGGMVAGTAELADVIAASEKPVWVYISDLCCSASYWVAAQADKVFCNSAATVGSIGVYCTVDDYSKLYETAGVKVNLIKAGRLKGAGIEGLPVTSEQLAEWQSGVDEIYAMFIEAVATGRELGNEQATALATGQVWMASQAMELGLVDGIASLEDVFEQLAGETMNKTTAFGIGRSASAKADATTAGTAAVDSAGTAAATDAVEPTAPVAATAQVIDKVEPVKTEPTADQITSAKASAVADERARVSAITDMAADNPQFAIEQIKAGTSVADASAKLNKLLSDELKAVKASVASGASQATSTGGRAVALGNAEKRDEKSTGGSFIRMKKH